MQKQRWVGLVFLLLLGTLTVFISPSTLAHLLVISRRLELSSPVLSLKKVY